jgi:hypothetical protein
MSSPADTRAPVGSEPPNPRSPKIWRWRPLTTSSAARGASAAAPVTSAGRSRAADRPHGVEEPFDPHQLRLALGRAGVSQRRLRSLCLGCRTHALALAGELALETLALRLDIGLRLLPLGRERLFEFFAGARRGFCSRLFGLGAKPHRFGHHPAFGLAARGGHLRFEPRAPLGANRLDLR